MAYRSRESNVLVACRVGIVPGVKSLVYHEYDLHAQFHGQGKSSFAPSLTVFNGRLYVFWKAGIGNSYGDIVYTSTEDGEEWTDLQITTFKTSYAPGVCHHRDHVYLVYLNQNKAIMLASSLDGHNHWSPVKSLRQAEGTLFPSS
jgi:hypothetical protein